VDPGHLPAKTLLSTLAKLAKAHPSTSRTASFNSIILVCVALVAVTFAVYLQVGNHQFIVFDDDTYVTQNEHVANGLTGPNIVWAFASVEEGNWHPVTWLSHMADVQLYGMNPRGHHLTNVALHIVSSLLLLFLLLRMTGSLGRSSFVAALFALHPLHVESVAWVAERKDLLCAFFWFLTLLFYTDYVKKRKTGLYLLTLFSFVLGLMSKPMLVTLPIVMLLIDFWPLERYRDVEQHPGQQQLSSIVKVLIKEKIPFFICSLFSGVITIYAQHKGGATSGLDTVPFLFRLENALVAYATYLAKTLYPHDLGVLYPIKSSLPLGQVTGSLFVLLLISVVALRGWRRYPFFSVGWFWFLITLLPVIGLIQVGSQSMADRYTYLPGIGLFIMFSWGVPALSGRLQHRERFLAPLAALVILASALATWRQLGYWRDSIALFQHTLQVTSNNYLINSNLGGALAQKGNLDAAIQQFNESLQINQNFATTHYNLGLTLVDKGDLDGGIQQLEVALRMTPNDAKTHYGLAVALFRKGSVDAGIRHYQAALLISPNDAKAHYGLGIALARKGDLNAAIVEYLATLRLSPDLADAHNNLGAALATQGNLDAAIQEFREVLRINPNDTFAQDNLGRALAQKSRKDEERR
jgi:protein O-mannosyl-transferase